MQEPRHAGSRRQVVAALAEQVRRLEGTARPPVGRLISTGCQALDRLLPERGLRSGGLVEWLSPAPGAGVGTLALVAAREACRPGGALVLVDRQGQWYPPAVASLGIDLERLVVVEVQRAEDELWALVEALRSPAVGAAWASLEAVEERALRRLQLAAEAGGSLGLLWRPAAARSTVSWADVRFGVEPLATGASRRWRIELVRCRGGTGGATVEIEWNDETNALHLVPRLADSTPRHRAAGA